MKNQINCKYDPDSKGGWTQDGRKVKGTIHWVCKSNSINIEMNLYERLFNNENLGENYLNTLNPNSLKRIKNAKMLDKFLDGTFIPTFETARGCPFLCTFCDQGLDQTKITTFSVDRLAEEIMYVGTKLSKIKNKLLSLKRDL